MDALKMEQLNQTEGKRQRQQPETRMQWKMRHWTTVQLSLEWVKENMKMNNLLWMEAIAKISVYSWLWFQRIPSFVGKNEKNPRNSMTAPWSFASKMHGQNIKEEKP